MTKKFNFDDGLKYSILQIKEKIISNNPIIINIGGGTASGKTTFSNKIKDYFQNDCIIISMDDYYKGISFINNEIKNGKECSFDHIESLNIELLIDNLKNLKLGNNIKKPIYCMKSQAPINNEIIKPKKIIIMEGIYALNDKLYEVNFDLSIFIDAPTNIRYERRLKRDQKRTNSNKEEIEKYFNIAEIMYQKNISKNIKNADLIINN